jgi:hypothetical protein
MNNDFSHLVGGFSERPKHLILKDQKYFKEELEKLGIHNLPKNYEVKEGNVIPGADFSSLSKDPIIIGGIKYDIYLAADEENHRGVVYLHCLLDLEDR